MKHCGYLLGASHDHKENESSGRLAILVEREWRSDEHELAYIRGEINVYFFIIITLEKINFFIKSHINSQEYSEELKTIAKGRAKLAKDHSENNGVTMTSIKLKNDDGNESNMDTRSISNAGNDSANR